MIKGFRDKEAEKLFHREASRKLPSFLHRVALRKLWMIDAAIDLADLRVPPGNHLEALSGKWKGRYSIRINKKWRICFVWYHNDAYDVEIVD